jgi:hypothetical protein
MYLTFATT